MLPLPRCAGRVEESAWPYCSRASRSSGAVVGVPVVTWQSWGSGAATGIPVVTRQTQHMQDCRSPAACGLVSCPVVVPVVEPSWKTQHVQDCRSLAACGQVSCLGVATVAPRVTWPSWGSGAVVVVPGVTWRAQHGRGCQS